MPNPCQGGGACTDGVADFTCACSSALTGKRCELRRFQSLGFLAGGDTTYTSAVSTDGLAVTGYGTIQDGYMRAYRWTQAGGIQNLGVVTGDNATYAYGINGDGSIVVGISEGPPRAFRWTSAGILDIGSLPGGDSAIAAAVSVDGSTIVGQARTGSAIRPVRWTSGQAVDMGVLTGYDTGYASGVNQNGSVIVGTCANNVTGAAQAFRWTSAGMVGLGNLSGQPSSSANGVSADGSVVIGASGARGFRWTAATGMVDLGVIPGKSSCTPLSVNSNGSVIVGTCNGAPQSEAFIWDQTRGLRTVASALSAAGVNTAGYMLEFGNGVSGDGKVVAGAGRDPLQLYQAWIARLP